MQGQEKKSGPWVFFLCLPICPLRSGPNPCGHVYTREYQTGPGFLSMYGIVSVWVNRRAFGVVVMTPHQGGPWGGPGVSGLLGVYRNCEPRDKSSALGLCPLSHS